MTTPIKKTLFATAATVVALGLGAATVAGVAHARGWGDGPGGCYQSGGPSGGFDQRQGGGQMGQRGPGGNPMAMMDGDQDGTLTRAEFDSFHGLAFKAMDSDGDGQVARQAFLDARTGAMGQGMSQRQGQGQNQNNRMQWQAEQRAELLGQRFDAWDVDSNGTVTQAEFTAQADSRFKAMDLDGDGQVTGQEMGARMMFGPRGPNQM
jgi:Ca2+-binding EF-hand superfamily protein